MVNFLRYETEVGLSNRFSGQTFTHYSKAKKNIKKIEALSITWVKIHLYL